jgi:hypothetical protein
VKHMLLSLLLLLSPMAFADAADNSGHDIIHVEQLNWMPGPEGLPTGSEFAVLEGDPTAKVHFTIRLRFPAGYKIAPHYHSSREILTIMKGQFHYGMGKVQTDDMTLLKVRDFVRVEAVSPHFLQALKATELQVSGMGPFDIVYIKSDDDPRKKQ